MIKKEDLIDFKKLIEYKKSNYGIFLGCGSSINDITGVQWKIIEKCDVWTSNNFIYHWFVPDFYHLELKSGKQEWLDLWRRRKLEKGDSYNKVKFIVNRDHCDHLLPQIGDHPIVFGYPRKVWKSNSSCKRNLNFANHSNNASFTLVLDLLSRMNYEKVVLFGVDLKNAKYFWTDNKEFGETHCNTNKNLKKDSMHTTALRVLNFTCDVSYKWFNRKLYLGYKKSLLSTVGIPYINIEKELL